jgi:hypothetical protein
MIGDKDVQDPELLTSRIGLCCNELKNLLGRPRWNLRANISHCDIHQQHPQYSLSVSRDAGCGESLPALQSQLEQAANESWEKQHLRNYDRQYVVKVSQGHF